MSFDPLPDEAPRSDLRARRRAGYRADLQSIAVELCLQYGYDAVTTRRIADRAGVSESTLFRSFGNKAGLICRNPFLPTLVDALALPFTNPELSVQDAVKKAVAEATSSISAEAWARERQRRQLIRREPELQVASNFELHAASDTVLSWIRARLGSAFDEPRARLYVAFLVAGFATVAFTDEATPEGWGAKLTSIIDIVGTGIIL